MTCADCIALASDHIDGLLRAKEAARLREHVERCESCARYLRVLERGLALARAIPDIEPSPGFEWRLNRRLRETAEAMAERQRSARSGAAVALAVAGLVALAAWSPILAPRPADGPRLISARPAPARDAATRADDADGWDWWYEGPQPVALRPPDASNMFPGPYSPLRVEPPFGHGDGRAVLMSLIQSE